MKPAILFKRFSAIVLLFCLLLGAALPVSAATESWEKNMLDVSRLANSALNLDKLHRLVVLDTLKEAPITSQDVSKKQNRSVLAWTESLGYQETLYIAGNDGVNGKEAVDDGLGILKDIPYLDFNGCLHLEQVTDMSSLFDSSKVRYVNFSGMDLSKVETMSHMFHNSDITLVDFTDTDTTSLKDISAMFSNCLNLGRLDLNALDVGRVTDMSYLFSGCRNLWRLDVPQWYTSSLVNIKGMFTDCIHLIHLDLSSWDTTGVTDFSQVFGRQNEKSSPMDTESWYLGVWETYGMKRVGGSYANFLPQGTRYMGRDWEDLFQPAAKEDLTCTTIMERYDYLRQKAGLSGGFRNTATLGDPCRTSHTLVTPAGSLILSPSTSPNSIYVGYEGAPLTEEQADVIRQHLYLILQAADVTYIGKDMDKQVRDWTLYYSEGDRTSQWEQNNLRCRWEESGTTRDRFVLEIHYQGT